MQSLSLSDPFFFPHLYWSINSLQWYVSFCFMTKWIRYTYTYIPISLPSCISLPPILLLDFKNYQKAMVIKTMRYWHKERHQLNRIESPEIKPYVYHQQVFMKGAKTIQWGKKNLFNKWCWDNRIATCKEWCWILNLTTYKNELKTDQIPKSKS